MAQAYVIKRLSDGRYFRLVKLDRHAYYRPKNSGKSREDVRESEEARRWTDDLQKARTYTNRGGAKNALPYKADPKDFALVPVKLVECEE